jgi:hypothetical protein
MANYTSSFNTYFSYPSNLTDKQLSVLRKWNGYDFDYTNCNHVCDILQEFVTELNDANVPYFFMEYEVVDEEGYTTSVDYRNGLWVVIQ